MVIHYYFFLLPLTLNQAFSNDIDEWSYKKWSVKSYGDTTKYISHGERIYGHQFGFTKNSESCSIDNLWLSLSSEDSRVRDLKGTEAILKITIGSSNFEIPVDLVSTFSLFSDSDDMEKPIVEPQALVFSNFIPNDNFISLLKSEHHATIEIVAPEELIHYVDFPSEHFSLDGFIAANLKAEEWCDSYAPTSKLSIHSEDVESIATPAFRGVKLGMLIQDYNKLDSVIKGYMPNLPIEKETTNIMHELRTGDLNKCQEIETPGLFKCYFNFNGELDEAELSSIQILIFNNRVIEITISFDSPKNSNAVKNIFSYYKKKYSSDLGYEEIPETKLRNYMALDESFWRLLQRGLSVQRPIYYSKLISPESRFSINFMYQLYENNQFSRVSDTSGVIVFRDVFTLEEINALKKKQELINARKDKLSNEEYKDQQAQKRLEVEKYMY